MKGARALIGGNKLQQVPEGHCIQVPRQAHALGYCGSFLVKWKAESEKWKVTECKNANKVRDYCFELSNFLLGPSAGIVDDC